ncbi:hypothetical protein [Halococcus salifodinae]|uniref:Uncharacterized protein n=1 Tax=Halococcus salifodinae DSM 8989 TaxID=1227456 RepID=M0MTI0_9EURY|nr:hypothetical protein [Halococcus salifodinae]EMA47785.1 hypothetical protein C450_20741 [Halococcus salifodinae DSM 8989]
MIENATQRFESDASVTTSGTIASAPCEPESPVPERVHTERAIAYNGPLDRERVRCVSCGVHIRYTSERSDNANEHCTECQQLESGR